MDSAEVVRGCFAYWDRFAVREWYECIRAHTFSTEFVELGVADARCFLSYQELLLAAGLSTRSLSDSQASESASDPVYVNLLPLDDHPRLQSVE
jgi:hypothetical protein